MLGNLIKPNWRAVLALFVVACACVEWSCSKPLGAIQWVRVSPGDFIRDGKSVQITEPFELSACEITRKQWHEVMSGASYGSPDAVLPKTEITRNDALAFCKKLGERDGRTYRLPYRDEWTYACLAGATTRYYWGNDFNSEYAWASEAPQGEAHPVGEKKPNAWGLYDMVGNVAELSMDDDLGGRLAVSLGGSIVSGKERCGCTYEDRDNQYEVFRSVGFRVVRVLR